MEIQELIDFQKKILDLTLQFIENNEDEENNFKELIKYNNLNPKLSQEPALLKTYLQLLCSISQNHHRNQRFFDKIEKIICNYESIIKENLTSNDIFSIFEENKRLIFYLFQKNIIPKEKSIIDLILTKDYYEGKDYKMFFITECEQFDSSNYTFSKIDKDILQDYDLKRSKGENDSPLATIIRKDSIDEFIVYCNQRNLSLNSKINHSIFETNQLLIETKPTLIEYAAFFGSIQIFQYLRINNAELPPSLWIYAIHSNNAELIQILDEMKIHSKSDYFNNCLQEAVLCYNRDISRYILENKVINIDTKKLSEIALKCHNFLFLPENFDVYEKNNQLNLVKYGYYEIVKLLIKDKKIEMNNNFEIEILNLIFF